MLTLPGASAWTQLDPTGPKSSDPMHTEPKTKVGAYALIRFECYSLEINYCENYFSAGLLTTSYGNLGLLDRNYRQNKILHDV